MAQHIVLILNQTVPQIQEPQVGDSYLMPRDVEITGDLAISGTVDGRDLAADGAIVDLALIPGDNISDLTNDAGYEANAALASQAEAEAGVENTKTMTPLRVAEAIAALTPNTAVKNNFVATIDPTTTNDDSEGYGVGSTWINKTSGNAFRCVDATTNLAVWVDTTVTASDLAAVAGSGDSDDLTEGAVNLLMTVDERAQLAALAGLTTGITAYSGGGQANAVLLTTRYNRIDTVAVAGDSVKLPAVTGGEVVIVKNAAALSMDVFPQPGGKINKLATDAALAVGADTAVFLFAVGTNLWESL